MKIDKKYKYKKLKRIIFTAEIMALVALGMIIVFKKNNATNNSVFANQNSITKELDSDVDTLDVIIPTPTLKPVPTIAPTPTVAPTPTIAPTPTTAPTPTMVPTPAIAPPPTPIVVPKAIWFPTSGPDYNFEKQTDKLVAFSFDDGPNAENTLEILQVLKEYNCTSTFFTIGVYAEKNPNIVKKVYNSGMEIASHSNNHEKFNTLTQNQGLRNLKKVRNILKDITGKVPVLFRPPGGNYNNLVRSYIDYPIIYWANDSMDYDNKYTDKEVINKATDGLNNGKIEGKIILFHDRVDRTADILRIIIPMIQEEGYKIVSVSEMYDYYDVDLENGQVYAGVKVKKR